MSTVPIEVLDTSDGELAKAMAAVKAARDALGEHWIATSHLAEAYADLYRSRLGLEREKLGRLRLGETA